MLIDYLSSKRIVLIIKALYKAIPAIAKNDPDATETDRARFYI